MKNETEKTIYWTEVAVLLSMRPTQSNAFTKLPCSESETEEECIVGSLSVDDRFFFWTSARCEPEKLDAHLIPGTTANLE